MTRMPFPPCRGTFACIVLAAFLCSACGPSSGLFDDRIEQDRDFGFDDLRQGTLLVAGVAAHPDDIGKEDRVRFGATLSNLLIEYLKGAPGIRLVGTGALVQRLGIDAYDDLMRGMDREGGLSREDLPVLGSAAQDLRYLLVAYLTNENVLDFSDEHYSSSGEEVTTDYEKRYYMTIDFQLYDVRREKMVLSHVIHNEATRTESRTTSTGCLEGCLQSAFQALLFGAPAEIDREEVLSEMVERFVERLRTAVPRTGQP